MDLRRRLILLVAYLGSFLMHAGWTCLSGTIFLLVGHVVFKASRGSGDSVFSSTTLVSSMQVGAIGGAPLALPIMLLESLPKSFFEILRLTSTSTSISISESTSSRKSRSLGAEPSRPRSKAHLYRLWSLRFIATIISLLAVGAAAGAIGVAILDHIHRHVLPIRYAIQAGIVGAAIVGTGLSLPLFAMFIFRKPEPEPEQPLVYPPPISTSKDKGKYREVPGSASEA